MWCVRFLVRFSCAVKTAMYETSTSLASRWKRAARYFSVARRRFCMVCFCSRLVCCCWFFSRFRYIYIYISTIDPHVQHQLIIDGIHYTNIIDWRNALNRSIDRVVFWCVFLSLACVCVCVCCDLFADSFIRINSSLLRRIINFLLLLPSFTCILFVWILQTPFESIIIALYRVQVFIVGWCVAVFRELKHL